MLKLEEKDYKEVEQYLERYMYDTFYSPLLSLLYPELELVNSSSYVVAAINNGTISYDNGVFKGKFNIKISKELSKYCDFDGRSKTFKLKSKSLLPNSIRLAVVNFNSKTDQIKKETEKLLSNLEDRFDSEIEPMLETPISKAIDRMQNELKDEFIPIGIKPILTENQKMNLIKDYNENQTLNIKNWNKEQIDRLRDAVVKIHTTGYNHQTLKDIIMYEWSVSSNKAKFLARQETSLFLSKFRREQSKRAGVTKYKWSSSHDERVRDKHKELNGKVFFYGDPPIVDDKTGRKAEPGEDFNCRCVAIPIIEEEAA